MQRTEVSHSGACWALLAVLCSSSMERAESIRLACHLPTVPRNWAAAPSCGSAWNVTMVAKTKGITMCRSSALKTNALCSHSLKYCSQRCSAPPAGNSGKRLTQFYEKDMKGSVGWQEGKQPSVKKISPRFQGQLQAGWPQAESGSEGGAVAGTRGHALHLVQVQQGLVQHPLCTEVFLFGALQLI